MIEYSIEIKQDSDNNDNIEISEMSVIYVTLFICYLLVEQLERIRIFLERIRRR